MPKTPRVKYNEGDWFVVPLTNGKYGLGLVARKGRQGVTLGYFFGPARESLPTAEDALGLRPKDAVLITLFGDLGIITGQWPLIPRSAPWNREAWPLPAFARIGVDEQRAWRVELSENDLEIMRESEAFPLDVAHFPSDGLDGSAALQVHLTKLLSQ